MKKTHEDRVNLISRLERKYALKVKLRSQKRRQDLKNALRSMRGQRLNSEDMRHESLDGIFRHDPRIA